MALVVVTPPAGEPLELPIVKKHLRVDWDDDDVLISALMTAAREYCEGFQRRAYVTRTLEFVMDEWPSTSIIRVPMPPLQAVESITYQAADGNVVEVPSTDYAVDVKSQPGRIVPSANKSWPAADLAPLGAITVKFSAGYGSGERVPQGVKLAMLLLIGHWYEHREAVISATVSKPIEFAVESLLWQDRVWW
jgi:uncharacterized phiE125 gp8 family phage protein